MHTKNLHILADFDRTLTKPLVDGVRSPSAIALLRNSSHLGDEYPKEAHALFDKYYPIESDPAVSAEEKYRAMAEWYRKHTALLIKSGVTQEILDRIVAETDFQFRDGMHAFVDYLEQYNIPLVIFSAGQGNLIVHFLEKHGLLRDNVFVIANFLHFDEQGRAIGMHDPLIHPRNKDETMLEAFPAIEPHIRTKKDVILLGDSPGDLGMAMGFDYHELHTFGYANKPEQREEFSHLFDTVLAAEDGLGPVLEFIKNNVSS